jgi:hypothetical protein
MTDTDNAAWFSDRLCASGCVGSVTSPSDRPVLGSFGVTVATMVKRIAMKTLNQIVGNRLPTMTMESVGVREQHVGA